MAPLGTQGEPSTAGRLGRGGARERAQFSPPGGNGAERTQGELPRGAREGGLGHCDDEGGGSDVSKLDNALACVDDFVSQKLGL